MTTVPAGQPLEVPSGPRQGRTDDMLRRQLRTVPAFRALLRSVEARFYSHLELSGPVIDLGCGDGHFAQMVFSRPIAVGIDPWWGALTKAQRTGTYDMVLQGAGDALPFADESVGTIISNSVLEHIEDVQTVLMEATRVLRPSGRLIFTTPSHYFTEWLGGAELMERMGLNSSANVYRRAFNRIARHEHTDPPEKWASRLGKAGFAVERWHYYFSKKALRALELGHLQGVPSAVLHALTGHWIVAPWDSSLAPTEKWIRPHYSEGSQEEGACIFFLARKVALRPISVAMPEARPELADLFTTSETRYSLPDGTFVYEDEEVAAPAPDHGYPSEVTATGATSGILPERENTPTISAEAAQTLKRLATATLLLVTLGAAVIGQSLLLERPAGSGDAIPWFTASLVAFALLVLRPELGRQARTWRLPRLRRPQVPPRRWYYLLAIAVALLAYRVGSASSSLRSAYFALALWVAGIATAYHALGGRFRIETRTGISRQTVVTAVSLALAAFLLRSVLLTSHPYILNGVEASIGLDALRVAEGGPISPFEVGWLTNPSLLSFVLAIPVRIFGPSVLGIRILSAVVGSVTVVALFLFGKRLFGAGVGLAAAMFLMGSHFHLHYSRLGMTNIWDPLFMLLGLGFLADAVHQRPETAGRRRWLVAGLCIGLNAYLFTASRLLPLVLVGLVLLIVIFERGALRANIGHLLACGALALIVSLPQALYYRNHPGLFSQRVETLGILDGQSGWLAQEAQRSGRRESEVLAEQITTSVFAFNIDVDRSPAYRPQVPLLGFVPRVLFFLGLVIALLKMREPRFSMLLLWVGLTMAIGIFLVENPSSHRLVIATPALCLLAAIAFDQVVRLGFTLANSGGKATRSHTAEDYLLPVVLVVGILVATNDAFFYFGRYQNQHSFGDRNTEAAHVIADYLNSLDTDWTVYFFGAPSMYVDFPTIPFLASEFDSGVNLFDVIDANSLGGLPPAAASAAYIFLPERAEEMSAIQSDFPDGSFRSFEGFHASPLFFSYEVIK